MSFNKSPLAFDDIREAFDRALGSPKGIRIVCTSRGAAVILRSRFNYYRTLDRKNNREAYTSDHPMWSKSPYDRLVLRVPPKGTPEDHILLIEPYSANDLQIELIE